MTYKQAAEFIATRRKRELEESEIAFLDALRDCPELLTVETELRGLLFDEAKGVKTNKEHLAELKKNKSVLLKKIGLTDDVLKPAPHCVKCADTAHSGDRYCDCVTALALSSDQKNNKIACTSFSKIDFTRFDPESREHIKNVYLTAKKICEKYPDGKRRIITLTGNTGTGKTLLAGCCATEMLSLKFSAVAVTAFDFFERCREHFTTFDESRESVLEPLLDTDLLIIDDLGTENIYRNITHEYLFNILNERMKTKLTIVTTNLSQEGILSRYGERVYSRLFDKDIGYSATLFGADMRTN